MYIILNDDAEMDIIYIYNINIYINIMLIFEFFHNNLYESDIVVFFGCL